MYLAFFFRKDDQSFVITTFEHITVNKIIRFQVRQILDKLIQY